MDEHRQPPSNGELITFAYAVSALTYAFSPLLRATTEFSSQVTAGVFWTTAVLAIISLVAILRVRERVSLRLLLSWLFSTLLIVATIIAFAEAKGLPNFLPDNVMHLLTRQPVVASASSATKFFALIALIGVNFFSLVSVFRFPAAVFLLPPLAIALVIGRSIALVSEHTARAWVIGIAIFVAATAALVVSYYILRLVLDHKSDVHRVLRSKNRWKVLKELPGRCIGPLVIVAALILAGWWLHDELQSTLKVAFYRTGWLTLAGPDDIPWAERDLQQDLHSTIDEQRQTALTKFQAVVAAALAKGDVTLEATGGVLQSAFDAVRPPPNPVPDRSCERFHIELWIGSIGFRNQCRDLVKDMNEYLRSTFENAARNSVALAAAQAKNINNSAKMTSAEVLAAGERSLIGIYDDLGVAVDWLFVLLNCAYIVGLLTIIGGTFGAFQLVFARAIFHHGNGNRFSLGDGHTSTPLTMWVHGHGAIDVNGGAVKPMPIRLTDDYPPPSSGKAPCWFIAGHLTLSGRWFDGRERPQFWACFFQRAFTLRHSWVRVGPPVATKTEWRGAPPEHSTQKFWPLCQHAPSGFDRPATIEVAAPAQIAIVQLAQGQKMVFRWRNFVGCTSGMRFHTVYSTHAGLHFLGLGNFFSYAEGDGEFIALRIDRGGTRTEAKRDVVVFREVLLAFDRGARFAIHHPPEVTRHWFRPSQVILSDPERVIITNAEMVYPGFLTYLGRLLRYMLLPF